MILTTHAIVGGAVAGAVGANPVASLVVGWASHYLLDWIPHWEYSLPSAEVDEKNPLNNRFSGNADTKRDILKLAVDFFAGLIISVLLFINIYDWHSWLLILPGIVGGLLPDMLQAVYMIFPVEPFKTLQRIHFSFHTTRLKLRKMPYLGVSLQLIVIIIALFLGNWRFFR